MYLIFLYCFIVIFIIYSFYLLFKILKIPNKVLSEYGKANISFWSSYYKFCPRGSINFIYIALYDNFLIFKSIDESFLINKDNFIEFNNKSLLKPYSIKFKTNDIHKYREIHFALLRAEKAQILKKYTENLK